jgi:spore coat protein U-like protein
MPASTGTRRRRGRSLLVALPLAAALQAGAVQCTAQTTSVAFGTYDPFANVPADTTGSVSVACDGAATYSIAISTGASGSFNRVMSSGSGQLAYGLHADAARSIVWGDGSGGSSRVDHAGTGSADVIYGRIPARQNVRAGSYVDALVVTVDF